MDLHSRENPLDRRRPKIREAGRRTANEHDAAAEDLGIKTAAPAHRENTEFVRRRGDNARHRYVLIRRALAGIRRTVIVKTESIARKGIHIRTGRDGGRAQPEAGGPKNEWIVFPHRPPGEIRRTERRDHAAGAESA